MGNYLLPRASCGGHLHRAYFRVIYSCWILFTEGYICHILSLSLTTILVNFYNCKSGAGTSNIALFFTHNIKSKNGCVHKALPCFCLMVSICASQRVSFPDIITLLKLSLKQSDVKCCISTFIASLSEPTILPGLHLISDGLNHIYISILRFIESWIDYISHSQRTGWSFQCIL